MVVIITVTGVLLEFLLYLFFLNYLTCNLHLWNRASLIDMPDGSKVILNKKEKVQREAIAKQLLTPSPDPHQQNTCKVVRHIHKLLNSESFATWELENDYSKYM